MLIAEAKGALGSLPNVSSVDTLLSSSLDPFYRPTMRCHPPPPPLFQSFYPLKVLYLCPFLLSPSAFLRPVNSSPTCYHHRLGTRNPGLWSASRHRSIIGRVALSPDPLPVGHLPAGDMPISHLSISVFLSSTAFLPPFGGNYPLCGPSVGSPPTSVSQEKGWPEPSTGVTKFYQYELAN